MVRARALLCHAACALAAFASATQATAAEAGYVRVSQVGYEAAHAMRAYLMSANPVVAATFIVEDAGGATLASGSVGAKTGDWGGFAVYAIDFNVAAAGTYAIKVSGDVVAASPTFPIDVASALYAAPLAKTLSFYRNERDGPDFVGSPLRDAAGHRNDSIAAVFATPTFDKAGNFILGALQPTGAAIDAAGGWWDAGDYLKFVQTTSYALALMEVGVRDFPNAMGAGSPASDFTAEAKFGLDWLQKMWDEDSRTLYYQVGVGSDFKDAPNVRSDHDLWRLPQADDAFGGVNPDYQYIRHRPVFAAGVPGAKISPNLAGRLAADFALCFQLFKGSDPAYAARCLRSAETIFDLADTAPASRTPCPNPVGRQARCPLLSVAPFGFYPEVEWRDDLELGASELYFAVRSGGLPPGLPHADAGYYLSSAARWARAYIRGANDGRDTLNLYDVSGLAHFELHRAIGLAGFPALAVTQTELANDIARQIAAARPSPADPFDAGYVWSNGDSASHIAGLSVMADEYAFLTGDGAYDRDARRWLGNDFGANAWGSSFVVGVGSTFPHCPQHQVANLVGSLTGGAPALDGAVVEGPNSAASSGRLAGMKACAVGTFAAFDGNGAVYADRVQSYVTTEPAIDLTATSMLMYAWRIAGSP